MTAVYGVGMRGGARPLRFLLLLLGGWTVVRVMAHWIPLMPLPPLPAVAAPDGAPRDIDPLWASATMVDGRPVPGSDRMTMPGNRHGGHGRPPRPSFDAADPIAGSDGLSALRLGMMARLLPPAPGGAARGAATGPAWVRSELLPLVDQPGRGRPFWMKRQLAGWSVGGWSYLRAGSIKAPDGDITPAGQLGGGQAGLRLAYGFGDSGRLRAFARVTVAIARPRQRELAIGFSLAPLLRLPVDVAVEQRLAVGSEGRTALAAMVSGGVGDVSLPHNFRLDAYGQAGVVGAHRRDGFVDAAVVVDRELARTPQGSLHLGALAAGAAQPGVSRVDVGPRMTLRLPHVGEGSRVALDWRQRVAGNARPDSGLAVTLAADF